MSTGEAALLSTSTVDTADIKIMLKRFEAAQERQRFEAALKHSKKGSTKGSQIFDESRAIVTRARLRGKLQARSTSTGMASTSTGNGQVAGICATSTGVSDSNSVEKRSGSRADTHGPVSGGASSAASSDGQRAAAAVATKARAQAAKGATDAPQMNVITNGPVAGAKVTTNIEKDGMCAPAYDIFCCA